MYGKINERKLRQTDYNLSCEQSRKQMQQYLDDQNKRVNVDSAKKLAVLQHMDYQGFRQMVLGANIFPTKSKELVMFTKGGQKTQLVPNKLFEQKKAEQRAAQELKRRVEGNSEKHCFNFRDFKKKFMKNYSKQLTVQGTEQCYQLVKQQDTDRINKIFNLQCEADILPKIIQVFAFVTGYLKSQEKVELKGEVGFMVKFLQTVLSIGTMQDISMNILSKKQKEKITVFLCECGEIMQDGYPLEVAKLVKK